MRFLALATDYDGTLAHDGRVTPQTLDALRRLKESGRKLILVSGRQLPELQETFPEYAIFDLIVAENGALLFDPHTRSEKTLADPPPLTFAAELRRRGVERLAEGRVILATWTPHETTVFETIRDLGLEMQVIFNKGAVMILPSGVNKASGLRAALDTLGLSPHNVVSTGDAENDHALLQMSEVGVAVQNALASLKESADLITEGDHGRGVEEVIEHLLHNDLGRVLGKSSRHDLEIGKTEDGTAVRLPAHGVGVMIAGTSGGGKSTLASTVIERLIENHFQFCIIDPEGDFSQLEGVIVLGDSKRVPNPDEVMTALGRPAQNCVVNLIALALEDRPAYFEKLFSHIMDLRTRTGRPHWLIFDEAHHILPCARNEGVLVPPEQISGMLFITLEPQHVARPILKGVDVILAIGGEPDKTIRTFTEALGEPSPELNNHPLEKGEAVAWWRDPRGTPFLFRSHPPQLTRHRHIRKYAEGDVKLGAFIFRGPEDKLKLRAQNLFVFLQIADGVDDPTWEFHLRRNDYENWFRWIIKDVDLADEAKAITENTSLNPEQSRKEVRKKIEEKYTAPK